MIDEVNSENKKCNKLFIILSVIFEIIIILLICYILYIKGIFDKKDEEVDVIEIPKVDNIKLYNAGGNVNLNCYNTTNQSYSSTVEKKDIIECTLNFDLYNKDDFYVKELYYTLEYGDGLELVSNDNTETIEYNVKNNGNVYRVRLVDASNKSTNTTYKFKVSTNETGNLFIRLDNIIIKNKKKEYYALTDSINKFTYKSNKYYIYRSGLYGYEIKSSEDLSISERYLDTYTCSSKDCYYLDDEDNYLIFNDSGFVIYDLDTKIKTKLTTLLLGYSYYDLIFDTNGELKGVIFTGEDGYDGYYSIDKSEILVNPSEKKFVEKDNYDCLFVYDEDNNEDIIIDYDGSDYKPYYKDILNVEGTNYYYIFDYYTYKYHFFKKNGTKLFYGDGYESYSTNENGELIIYDNERYYRYNSSYEKVYMSKKYGKVIGLYKEYIATIDSDGLNIIKGNDEKVATFSDYVVSDYYNIYYDNISNSIYIEASKCEEESEEACDIVYYVYSLDDGSTKTIKD